MARGGLWGGSEVALGVGGVAQWWHWGMVGSVGWHRGGNRDLWGDTGVALGAQGWHRGVCAVWGWNRGGIGGL